MEQELEILEAKFQYFLNQTIIGASKDYYKKQMRYELRELRIIDDENYEQYLGKYIEQDDCGFLSIEKNYELNKEFKLLSLIERTVIFLYFEGNYKTNEIAKILNIKEQSVSRIKKRALTKLKNSMKGFEKNESLYLLGIKAKAGDEVALVKIIERKRNLIKKVSFGDEDRYQYIIEKLIKGIKSYKF